MDATALNFLPIDVSLEYLKSNTPINALIKELEYRKTVQILNNTTNGGGVKKDEINT